MCDLTCDALKSYMLCESVTEGVSYIACTKRMTQDNYNYYSRNHLPARNAYLGVATRQLIPSLWSSGVQIMKN